MKAEITFNFLIKLILRFILEKIEKLSFQKIPASCLQLTSKSCQDLADTNIRSYKYKWSTYGTHSRALFQKTLMRLSITIHAYISYH